MACGCLFIAEPYHRRLHQRVNHRAHELDIQMNNAGSSRSSAGLEHSRSTGNSTSDRPQRTSIIVALRSDSSPRWITSFAI